MGRPEVDLERDDPRARGLRLPLIGSPRALAASTIPSPGPYETSACGSAPVTPARVSDAEPRCGAFP